MLHCTSKVQEPVLRVGDGARAVSVKTAGMGVRLCRRDIPDAELLGDLRAVAGRLKIKRLSRCSITSYRTHFGSFNKAMLALDRFLNPRKKRVEMVSKSDKSFRRKTARHVGPRLRFLILRRDNFRCCACGRSPVTHAGLSLQVDHKVPWRKGGETVEANLQTLCEGCNGGKSDLAWEE